jgi:hypothetical protein
VIISRFSLYSAQARSSSVSGCQGRPIQTSRKSSWGRWARLVSNCNTTPSIICKQEVLGRINRLLPLMRRVQQFFYCCVCIRCGGNVSTEPLPSNDRGDTHTDISFLGNSWVKQTLPRQGRIVGGVVFYAVCVVSKEIRRLVIPRTFCLKIGEVSQKWGLCFLKMWRLSVGAETVLHIWLTTTIAGTTCRSRGRFSRAGSCCYRDLMTFRIQATNKCLSRARTRHGNPRRAPRRLCAHRSARSSRGQSEVGKRADISLCFPYVTG